VGDVEEALFGLALTLHSPQPSAFPGVATPHAQDERKLGSRSFSAFHAASASGILHAEEF
jgi:hypothetical protein